MSPDRYRAEIIFHKKEGGWNSALSSPYTDVRHAILDAFALLATSLNGVPKTFEKAELRLQRKEKKVWVTYHRSFLTHSPVGPVVRSFREPKGEK